MKPLTMLESLIARRTDLDSTEIAKDVINDFFDDQQTILYEIMKGQAHNNPAECGKILASMLNEVIAECVRQAEKDADLTRAEDTAELNRMLFDRSEARAINWRQI